MVQLQQQWKRKRSDIRLDRSVYSDEDSDSSSSPTMRQVIGGTKATTKATTTTVSPYFNDKMAVTVNTTIDPDLRIPLRNDWSTSSKILRRAILCIFVLAFWCVLSLVHVQQQNAFVSAASNAKDSASSSKTALKGRQAITNWTHVEEHWLDYFQTSLCPAQVPDASKGHLLFQIAKSHLLEQPDLTTSNRNRNSISRWFPSWSPPSWPFVDLFYAGEFSYPAVFSGSHGSVVYLPIWKAANDQIRDWMTHSFQDVMTKTDYRYLPDIVQNPQQYKDPLCLVTAIRDPISRFLSGYNEIEYRRDETSQFYTDMHVAPLDHLAMPFSTHDERLARFRGFVRDLVTGDPNAWAAPNYFHIYSMSRILVALRDLDISLTAYQPGLGSLSASFPQLVKSECATVLEPYLDQLPKVSLDQSQHPSSKDPEGFYQAAKDVWADQGDLAKALCSIHAMDYACWPDLETGIPDLCKDQYSSLEFLRKIL